MSQPKSKYFKAVIICTIVLILIADWLTFSYILSSNSDGQLNSSAFILPVSHSSKRQVSTNIIVSQAPIQYSVLPIKAPNGFVRALIATTSEAEEKGLGDRSSLPADQGMIFYFSQPGIYSFWMKDMRFPLDMVWIDANKRVAGVSADISPDTYPASFTPPSPISYVLELNAGAAAELGIIPGTILKY